MGPAKTGVNSISETFGPSTIFSDTDAASLSFGIPVDHPEQCWTSILGWLLNTTVAPWDAYSQIRVLGDVGDVPLLGLVFEIGCRDDPIIDECGAVAADADAEEVHIFFRIHLPRLPLEQTTINPVQRF